jgi:hypothetical protein
MRPEGSTLGVRPEVVPLGDGTGQVILQPMLPKSDWLVSIPRQSRGP